MLDKITQSFKSSDRTHGARRVWYDMLAEGLSCGLHHIERLMRGNALRARPRGRGLPKDAGERAAIMPNVLDRQLEAERPNQKWVADAFRTKLMRAQLLDFFTSASKCTVAKEAAFASAHHGAREIAAS